MAVPVYEDDARDERMDVSEIVAKWRARKIRTKGELDVALHDYRILFAYHSNRIEGAGVDLHQTREIFENGKVTGYTGELRNLFEAENQKLCYDFLKEQIVSRAKLTPELVLEVHRLLTHGCYDEVRWENGERPGTYKKHMYGVGLDAGVAPEDVEAEIAFLCRELETADSDSVSEEDIEHCIVSAAYFHCNFENVHPFADGNGRVGRTLMNYYLMIHDVPPVVIFEEDREAYFMALAVFDRTEELSGFVSFLKDEMVKTWVRTPRVRAGKARKVVCI